MITAPSFPFISGMSYRANCDFHFDEFIRNTDIILTQQFDGMSIFVKTDYLHEFSTFVLPYIKCKFFLYTHNSDLAIRSEWMNICDNKLLQKWYAQNVCFLHDKLQSIPIGIANKRWVHGNTDILQNVIDQNNEKTNLVYCNFDVGTNVSEREYCLNNLVNVKKSQKTDFKSYLEELSKSYFVVSPNGNGIDCHKHWEALYLKAIPIVTWSVNISHYGDFPFLLINDWSDFKYLNLTPELYKNMMKGFDIKDLYLNEKREL